MLYLIPLPETRLDKRGRGAGWEHVRVEREGRKQLKAHADQLRNRGISELYVSDLDSEAGEIIARELNVPLRKEFQLRRFNVGANHGEPLEKIEGIFTDLLAKWQKNRDIPMRKGDSLTSYEKRMLKMYDALISKESVALVADDQTIRYWRDLKPEALIRNGHPVDRTKIYCLKRLV